MITNKGTTFLFIMATLSASLLTCLKDYEILPRVRMLSVKVFSLTTIEARGKILNIGSIRIKDHGFCWSATDTLPTIDSPNSTSISKGQLEDPTEYEAQISISKPCFIYYFRSYITLENNLTYYSDEVNSISTNGVYRVELSGGAVSNNMAVISGVISGLDASQTDKIDEYGFVYTSRSRNAIEVSEDCLIDSVEGLIKVSFGSATSDGPFPPYCLQSLGFNTSYFARAFSTENGITTYGDIIIDFETKDGWTPVDSFFLSRDIIDPIFCYRDNVAYFGLGCSEECLGDGSAFTRIWKFSLGDKGEFNIDSSILMSYGGAGRKGQVSFILDDVLYFGLGYSQLELSKNEIWRYSANLGLKPLQDAPFPLGRRRSIAFRLNHDTYVGLGEIYTLGSENSTRDFYLFDSMKILTRTRTIGQFEADVFNAKAYDLHARIYVTANEHGENRRIWAYDQSEARWTTPFTVPQGARDLVLSISLEDELYLGFGGSLSRNTFWVFRGGQFVNQGIEPLPEAIDLDSARPFPFQLGGRMFFAFQQKDLVSIWEYVPLE